MRFAYADPPYVGQAKRYPGGVEVNHRLLIGWLETEFDGWALSCSAPSLPLLLSFVTVKVRVLSWVKPYVPHRPGVWPTYAWEPVICVPLARPSDRSRWTPMDWFQSKPAGHSRGGAGKQRILGEKPPVFVSWMLECCRVERQDEVVDVFPGSGAVGEAVAQWRAQTRLAL